MGRSSMSEPVVCPDCGNEAHIGWLYIHLEGKRIGPGRYCPVCDTFTPLSSDAVSSTGYTSHKEYIPRELVFHDLRSSPDDFSPT